MRTCVTWSSVIVTEEEEVDEEEKEEEVKDQRAGRKGHWGE